ncbi:MAG: hypothetical protein QXM65_07180 [Candidatus Bathyarchaeia archaeon]
MPLSESTEHKEIKNIISSKLQEWTGASLEEYLSAGHELDIFAVTPNGISICIEIIWSPTKQNFYRDLSLIQQSDANIKLLIASPEILANEDYQRDFSKVAISERRKGITMYGELINGAKILEDTKYIETEFKNIVLGLIDQAQSEGKTPTKEIIPPEAPSPDKKQELLMSNLFPVIKYPSTIFSSPTDIKTEPEVFKNLGDEISRYPFILKSKRLYTFHNLKSPSSPFKPIILTNEILEELTYEWIKNGAKRNDLIRLLNLTLRVYCQERGMRYDKKHRRYTCLLKEDGKDNIFSWRAGSKFVHRTIAKKVYSKQGGLLYCRHYAAELRFMFLDDNIFLKIEPTITFTSDGYNPFRLDKLASLMSRWLPKQYNNTYLLLVRFWAKYLSKLDVTISIPAGDQKIEIATTPMAVPIEIGIAKETIPSSKLRKNKNDTAKEIKQ